MSEEYSVGYSEGYQAGWNAAMDTTPPAQPAPVQEPVALRPEDVTVEVLMVQSGGGFAPLKTHGVKLTHKPTGIIVQCSGERSQHRNREQALRDLERYLHGARPQPTPPAAPVQPVALEEYDAGLLNDYGGGNVEWWKDYIRAELGRAYDHYLSQITTPPAQPAPVQEPVTFNEELHQERERRQQLEAELMRMQGRELKLQMALNTSAAPARTDRQIVDETEALAKWLMAWSFNGYLGTNVPIRQSEHPFAKSCWAAACHIQEMLTATDPENSVAELDVDTSPAAQPAPVISAGPITPAMQAGPTTEQKEQMVRAMQSAYPTAPVQEPVAIYQYQLASGSWIDQTKDSYDYNVRHGQATVRIVYTTPPAQPAVPDAFGTREGEHPQYIQGWNDCRAEMLKGMKP
jgi:hypothetical protein